MAPDVISRDASGRTTVRAIKLTMPLRVDGQLDDETLAQPTLVRGLENRAFVVKINGLMRF